MYNNMHSLLTNIRDPIWCQLARLTIFGCHLSLLLSVDLVVSRYFESCELKALNLKV